MNLAGLGPVVGNVPHPPGKGALTGPEELRSTSGSPRSVSWGVERVDEPVPRLGTGVASPGGSIPGHPGLSNALAIRGKRQGHVASSHQAADMHVFAVVVAVAVAVAVDG